MENLIEAKPSVKLPLKIFISHKISEHGNAVKELKKILTRNGLLNEKLKVFVSTETESGENWFNRFHSELDKADMLIYVYCYTSPLKPNDWCNYEIGYYYAKKLNKSKIVTIIPYDFDPPSPIKDYEIAKLNEEGIEKLFKTIYKDLKVWPELFERGSEDELEGMVKKVLKLFNPTKKPVPLSPRLWITIPNRLIDKFREGETNLLKESIITGETEAAKRFGYEEREKKVVQLKELPKIAEYKGTLEPYFVVLADTLQEILNNKPGPWKLPPLKVLNDKPPNMLVPAYLQKLSNGDYKFEFIVTQPPINFGNPYNRRYVNLYNLFIVAWHFRWRVINKYLLRLKRLKTAREDQIRDELREIVKKMEVDLNAVILDSANRQIQVPADVTINFEGDDKELMEKIVDSQKGLWFEVHPIFVEGCKKLEISTLIDCLQKFQNMNKTCLVTVLRLLQKDVENLDGEILF
jgi:hypothetical protein